LTSGLKVKKLALTHLDDGAEFFIDNLIVDYSLDDMDGDKKLIHVKNISLDKFIIIGSDSAKTHTSSKIKNDKDDDHKRKTKNEENMEEFDLLIDKIAIKNVIFKENLKSKGFSLEKFVIKNLLLNKRGLKFEKIDIVSSILKLSGFSKVVNGTLSHIELKGSVTPQIIDKLKEELPFEVSIKLENLRKLDLKLNAYLGKIQLGLSSYKNGHIKFDDMNLMDKFEADWPITWLNGELLLPKLSKDGDKDYSAKGTLQFMNNDKSYDLIEDSFELGKNQFSFLGQGEKSKVKVEYFKSDEGRSELLVTEQ
jgi:hypothetical protein